ncbi:MAG: IS1595 family transposase [Bauldia sp.]
MTNLTDEMFHDNDAARVYFEKMRWPNGQFCPHCGNADPETITGLAGTSHRKGLYQCNACREPFTVTVGGVMESSHIPLCKWALAFHLMAASKKGVSAHQLMRTLGLGSYRTAWFMAHRVREAMKIDNKDNPIGGSGKVVEVDETYQGRRENPRVVRTSGQPFIKKGKKGTPAKRPVVALVERGGETRMFHVENATAANLRDVMVRNIKRESELHTDESRLYTEMGKEFDGHHTVKHSAGEYVRYEGERTVHSNTVENVFSVFKRGMTGVYQHCGEAHLHRYLAEFEFRYNRRAGLGWNDSWRADEAVKGAEGKRLMYRQPREAGHA